MGEHGFKLVRVQCLQQPAGDRDDIVALAKAGRISVQARCFDDFQARHHDAAGDAQVLERVVELGRVLALYGFRSGRHADQGVVRKVGDCEPCDRKQRGEAPRALVRGEGGLRDRLERPAPFEKCSAQQIERELQDLQQHDKARQQERRPDAVGADMAVETVDLRHGGQSPPLSKVIDVSLLELDFRRGLDGSFLGLVEIEKVLRRKAHRICE